jgi:hypothetical protein
MRAVLSEPLQAYVRHHQITALTITLDRMRCCGGTLGAVSVATQPPKDPERYASFAQGDLCIYYSPALGRRSALLELDYVRTVFRYQPVLTGPEELIACVLTDRL